MSKLSDKNFNPHSPSKVPPYQQTPIKSGARYPTQLNLASHVKVPKMSKGTASGDPKAIMKNESFNSFYSEDSQASTSSLNKIIGRRTCLDRTLDLPHDISFVSS